jgi:hypothetical protein
METQDKRRRHSLPKVWCRRALGVAFASIVVYVGTLRAAPDLSASDDEAEQPRQSGPMVEVGQVISKLREKHRPRRCVRVRCDENAAGSASSDANASSAAAPLRTSGGPSAPPAAPPLPPGVNQSAVPYRGCLSCSGAKRPGAAAPRGRCVLVVGPESSGSKLAAQIVAHALIFPEASTVFLRPEQCTSPTTTR